MKAAIASCIVLGLLGHGLAARAGDAPSDPGTDLFPKELVEFSADPKQALFTGAGPGHWDVRIRERGWMMREDGLYRMWYTGFERDSSPLLKLGYATSPDGIRWTRSDKNPIYGEHWVEDMMVVRHDGIYSMFAEGKDDRAQRLTSADGITWKRVGQLDVRKKNGEPIEPGPCGTPTAWVENGVWYLFYERGDLGIWLATSKDLEVWTNVQDGPVISLGPADYDKEQVALNQIVKHNGRYYAYYHGAGKVQPGTRKRLWCTCVATSKDLMHWEKYAKNPIFPLAENKSSGILVHDGKRFLLYTMHDQVVRHVPKAGALDGAGDQQGNESPARAKDGKELLQAYFEEEVWTKVGERTCLTCHKPGGDAEDSKFLLRDPKRSQGAARAEAMKHNREAFARMARLEAEGHQSRILMKVVGKLEHGGKEQVKPDSAEYRLLADFVRRVNAPSTATSFVEDKNALPFFDGVVMVDDRKLLRRVTLSLAGRLPTDAEQTAVVKQGLKAMPALLDAIMKEDAFYDRLREGFEDIFLTLGLEETDNSSIPLSYEHFSKSRHWFQNKDLVMHIEDEKERMEAHRMIHADTEKAIRDEPMKFIEHVVRNNRPFTEIVTADYLVVSPYSARCYGIFEEIKSKFKNSEDPFEYIPVKLKALVSGGKSKEGTQESATGFYPHAGILSTFHYLRRYPTTETNRNRLRVRMFYEHFLGVNVLDLAARVTDAAAVSAKYKNPTMQAAECVVCHKAIDPVAGLFQDYWTFEKGYGRRKEGWFTDMFSAGFEGEDLPAGERWRALQWLGERTAKDPRFAVAMVEHAYYLLTGRKVLLPPKDLDDPLYNARRRAYQAQRKQVEGIATRFAATGFNFKNLLKDWVLSDFYRADGLATVTANPQRRAELDDVGLVRMLAPEQVERKVAAVFGQPWGKLNGQLAILYGGIDSKEVTQRAADPSGAMGSIQRILANDVACKQTARDFSRKPAERQLFPNIEPDVLPGASPNADAKIRQAIVYLHQRVLGRYDTADSKEVERTFQLFAGIVSDAANRKGLDAQENYACRQGLLAPVPDPHYTVRAWRGVVTYLLRQHEFLYE